MQLPSAGQPLAWEKTTGSRWIVFPGNARSARVTYRVFANAPMSATFSVLDRRHASWNGPSLFMYVDGQKQHPVTLSVLPQEDWTVINPESARPGQRFFHFPTYDHLAESATEVAPPSALQFDSFVADDRFYRIDDRLSRKQEGSGLGLAIVRHVVQAHGGQVRVRNQEQGGAEFSLVLPIA